jgi:hypothetical protein
VSLSRRGFLEAGALCLAGAALPLAPRTWAAKPLRVRGAVRAGGKGIAKVAVSDGQDVVATAADGTYELITMEPCTSLQISLPSGYRIPRDEQGIARLSAPVRSTGRGEGEALWELQRVPDVSDRHAVLLLADVQTRDAVEMKRFQDETVPDLQETVRSLAGTETFAVACGDIMYDQLELFPEYERGAARTGIPHFQVVGNHDLDMDALTDPRSTRTFVQRYGPRYFSFERGAVHYVVLDDVFWYGGDYIGHLDADQLRWLAADLALVERGRTVVVLLHIPALGTHHLRQGNKKPIPAFSLTNRELLLRLLEPYRTHLLAGHIHESEHGFGRSYHEHVAGAVCGAWWTGPICADGTPNGYAIYEIAGEKVSWRYKSTGKPLTHQMRLYPRGARPGAPDEIVVNVWDWDPEWKVVWFEDGEPRGPMTPRRGTDPLAQELFAGPDKPGKHDWIEPYPVDHLFQARPAPAAKEITVEATDRFGRVCTERVRLSPTGPGVSAT